MREIINFAVLPAKESLKIKEKDRKFLEMLFNNSRRPANEIGKKLRISKVAISNKFKSLEKKKIIVGYSCFINFSKFGFKTYSIGIKVKMDIQEKESYLKKVKNLDFVCQVLKFSGGKWDFLIRVICPEKEVNFIIDNLSNKNTSKIDLVQMQKGIFEDVEFETSSECVKNLTQKEINLLYELAKNSRQTIVNLSVKLKISPKTIIKMIKYLQHRKIILGFPTLSNIFLYGNQAYLFLITTHKRSIQDSLAKEISKIDSTGVIVNFQNPNLISFHIISNLNSLKKIEEKLKEFPDVFNYNFVRIEEQSFYTYFPKRVYESLMSSVNKSKTI